MMESRDAVSLAAYNEGLTFRPPVASSGMKFGSLLAVVGILICVASFAADEAANEFFEKKVRPILIARCHECHSGTAKRLEGSLRLDGRAFALKGGDTAPAIVPGKPQESLLVDAINYGELYQMPPNSKLPAEEIEILTQWVKSGAVWPNDNSAAAEKKFDLEGRRKAHWAWQPIQDVQPPPVKNAAWPMQPLDRFILAKLEAQGFAPAASADKRTLLRRVYFDLIGLPPSPEDVNAFVADESPQALEKVVDKLLGSPQFGERWARHWLDLTRYAESRGHEFDYDAPNAFQYRDFVIRALNADLPYDQFAIEHIAGDLLPQPRLNHEEGFNESILGTGYWFLGEWVHSPVDLRKDEADRFDNMVDVFSKTFLGLTVACARCHDHKFDAISQGDYYAMFGYLKSSGYRLSRFDTEVQHKQLAAEFKAVDERLLSGLLKARAAWAKKPAEQIAERLLAEDERLKDGPWKELWELANTPDKLKDIARQRQEQIAKANEGLAKAQVIVDYRQLNAAWHVDGPAFGNGPMLPGTVAAVIDGENMKLSIAELGGVHRDARWNGLSLAPNSAIDSGSLGRMVRAGKTIASPTFTLEKPNIYCLVEGTGQSYAAIASHSVIHGPLHGNIVQDLGGKVGEAPLRWVQHSLPSYVGHRFHMEISAKDDEPLNVLMIVQGDQPPPLPVPAKDTELAGRFSKIIEPTPEKWAQAIEDLVVEALPLLAENRLTKEDVSADSRAIAQFILTSDYFRPAGAEQEKAIHDQLAADYRKATQDISNRIRRDSRLALAMWDIGGEDERLMIRGNPSPKTLGPAVPRNLLTAVNTTMKAPAAAAPKDHSGRLELAVKMMQPENPFPARVLVNRVWHHLLGRGIVPSTDNFGVLGQSPTHPELLDFLAREFQRDGWSQKRLIKTILLSRTYQQASDPAAKEVEDRDPQNLTWRRANVRRLEGEAIRDTMLALSGRLDKQLYGPPVPLFLNEFLQGRGRPASGPLDGNGRRSIYISIRRNFLSPMMLAFDTPSPFSTVGRRNVSNVPAQALILMNDPFVIEQAKKWAKSLLAQGESSPETRIAKLYEQAYGREPTDIEVAEAMEFLKIQAAALGMPPEKALSDERTWSDLCHVLWNVKEFVFLR